MERGVRLFVAASVAVLVAAGIAIAAVSMHFNSPMEGAQEAPVPRDTQARGNAVYKLSADGTHIEYKVIVANIENVFMAHIHCGAPTVNGPITVWLYPSTAVMPGPAGSGRHDGVLVTGTFTDANVIDLSPSTACPGGIDDLADVLALLQNGGAYVNVHTNLDGPPFTNQPGDIPGGEIRGNTP